MPWMTKDGFCGPATPFVTCTPYCVEALFRYHDATGDEQTLAVAQSSLDFLERDLNVLRECPDELVLSYGPGISSRLVFNSNAYAMMLYALFGSRLPNRRKTLLDKAARIFRFIIFGQDADGSWPYYADDGKGNFIDCFHSCFILKNLIKYSRLSGIDVKRIVDRGLNYILENFMDPKRFLARRFAVRANPTLARFDLYDQAELLNVLCLVGRSDLARRLHDAILKHFYIPSKGTFGYQIDMLGLLHGMTYLRWAIMPTVLALTEYYKSERNGAGAFRIGQAPSGNSGEMLAEPTGQATH